MATNLSQNKLEALRYCALAALIMAYGWGYRGTVGHEAGAMVPGAMLGLAVCLGSGRLDWHRRATVAGAFAAIGWAWGGSLSYMEQTLYTVSDSFPDVLYGYTMLFFLGALWAGIGGGVLGLALTEPRSELERLIRPFTAICAAFLAVYIYFFFATQQAEAYETLTVQSFHDNDWLAATIVILVSGVYWLARPADRRGTALFFWGGVAWWVGYLGFTKFGGLRLGPLHRSEGWGGIVGVLVVLLIYLIRRQNRAALMLCLYGILGGGLSFSAAVFIRHPGAIHWGPFTASWPQWRVAEESFGLLMGLSIALGALRLIRGGLVPPVEDTPRAPLDVYAVFLMLIGLIWINFRRHAAPWLAKADASATPLFLGWPMWCWYVVGGAFATAPALYLLYRYWRGDRALVPASPFGKGALVALLLVWVTVAGYTIHEVPALGSIAGHLILWIPAAAASFLVVSYGSSAADASVPGDATFGASDTKWRVGRRYGMVWAAAPVFLLCITTVSTAMQNGPLEGLGRKRFGPDAYWRQTARLMGEWRAVGVAKAIGDSPADTGGLPVKSLTFDQNRNVSALMASGEVVKEHQWFLKNQYTWLRWYGKAAKHPERAEIPLEFRGKYIYLALPKGLPDGAFTVFARVEP